jgi:spore maturation protein CgeB
MKRPLDIVVLGLSLSSSWGNGHATTYRALLKAFAARGHRILFLEREKPWYAANRDLARPGYCRLAFYDSVDSLAAWSDAVAGADAVIVGSYIPEGVAVAEWVFATARGVVAFYDIDTPVTLARLEADDREYLSPDAIPRFDLYLSFTGGPTLDRLVRRHGARMARALYCSADPAIYRPAPGQKPRWDLSYLGTYSEDRQPTLERLLIEPARRAPDLRFMVGGPGYPDGLDWPRNVERRDHIAPEDHSAFYAASRFTLNVTRRDMIRAGYSPSVRLFEAAACATPILSDVWDGIESLFRPGAEIALPDSPQAVLHLLENADEARRTAMGSAARARFFAQHTAAHRAEELESHLADAAAARLRARSMVV